MPKLHGILRGKYEYEPNLGASRFEVRNARLSVNEKLIGRSEYKLEVDLCDESVIKMKDARVRLNPYKTLRLTIGQQTMLMYRHRITDEKSFIESVSGLGRYDYMQHNISESRLWVREAISTSSHGYFMKPTKKVRRMFFR